MAANRVPDDSPEEQKIEAALRKGFSQGKGMPPDSVLLRLRTRAGFPSQVTLPDPAIDHGPIVEATPNAGRCGRYQVVGAIAEGGIGLIYQGRDVDLGREVAIKVLRERHRGNDEVLQRFVEEAQIGGQLQHPGIVPVYELGLQGDDQPFFAMKLVRGQTLAALLERRCDPADNRRRFLTIFEQVCQTVAYAHARGVVHRDLKPANVMIGSFGEVQVVDWGLAKVLGRGGIADERRAARRASEPARVDTVRTREGSAHSTVGSVMGTAAYMPPEQARGEVEQLDERSDVFALGAILCEVLTGAPPYVASAGEELLELAASHAIGPCLERLSACGVESELIELVRQCLHGQAAARPRDASLVAARVTAHLGAVEERARAAELEAAEARVRADDEHKARRLTLGLAVAVLAVVAVAGGSWLWLRSAQEARASATDARVQAAMQATAQRRGRAEAMASGAASVALWRDAEAAAEKAQALAADPDTGWELRAQAAQLHEEVAGAATAAAAALQAAERRQELLQQLEAVRLPSYENIDAPDWRQREGVRRDAGYAAAFRGYGVDIDASPIEAAAKVLAGDAQEELAAALDSWAMERRRVRPDASDAWHRLFALADAVDGEDPWRDALRAALAGEKDDLAALRRLAAAPDLGERPPVCANLLGTALGNAGDLAAATAVFNTGRQHHPGDFTLQVNSAQAFELAEPRRWADAARCHQAALALRPGEPQVRYQLAIALACAGNHDEAEVELRKVLQLRPDGRRAHHNLGVVLLRRGELEPAAEAFRAALALAPDGVPHDPEELRDQADTWLRLHRVLIRLGKTEDALAALREVILRSPEHGDYRVWLSVLLHESGQWDEAAVVLNQLAGIDPVRAARARVGMYLKRGDHAAAFAATRELVQLVPDDAAAQSDLVAGAVEAGDLELALAAAERAVALDPKNAEAHYNLGSVHLESGHLEPAIHAYAEAIRLQPDYAKAHCNLGHALRRTGRYRESLRALQRGHELGSVRGDWLYPSADWVRQAERLAALEQHVADALAEVRGEVPGEDWIASAELACDRQLFATGVRLYAKAFAADPGLVAAIRGGHGEAAARAAARALLGTGEDAVAVEAQGRAHLRSRACAWLQTTLDAWRTGLASGDVTAGEVVETLERWQTDGDFAGLRAAGAGASPAAEGAAPDRSLWTEVEALRQEARTHRGGS